jgi:hypothetical protein
VFGTVLIVVCTLMQIYLFWRAASVPVIRRRVGWKILLPVGLLLWVLLYAGRTLGHGGKSALAAPLEFFGMTWMAALFLMFISMLAADLLTGFGLLFRRHAPRIRGWALLAGVLLAIIALIQGLRPPVIVRYEVRLAGLPQELDGTTVAAMSDTHLGSQIGAKWLKARVAQVQALRPDLIVLLGDIFEGHGEPPPMMVESMRGLFAPLGVWAVPGNHERYRGNDQGFTVMAKSSIPELRDEWVELHKGLVLAGVEDLTSARRSGRGEEAVDKALSGRPQGATILLSHSPLQTASAAAEGVGLMLCGHTHAGQVWPFSYLIRMRYPYVAGRYEIGGMTLIVCRGTSTWGPRMRLWRPSEILYVTLRCGST